MKNGNKNSIFENCHETASQEIYLRRCGFALQDDPPDSDPSIVGVSPPLNDGVASHRASDDSDSVVASGYEAVENQAIRFVSPEPSTDTAESEEDAARDRTVLVESEENAARDRTVRVESEVDVDLVSNQTWSSSSGERLESPWKVNGGKKLKIPLRDVVKAIVMNSRNNIEEEEEDRVIEKMSYVQFLAQNGFKFP
ncbi:unnamed protein product [Arabis nemorensis]|uniref:Uncharacterized protein n=1 Tax=Arabis nemorensis TaxID=586526 RepID=A0A565AU78_9BRAS|nr:unnamed protein product [Arabis nemorensis]